MLFFNKFKLPNLNFDYALASLMWHIKRALYHAIQLKRVGGIQSVLHVYG